MWRGENCCPYRDSNCDPSAVQPAARPIWTVRSMRKADQSPRSSASTFRICLVTRGPSGSSFPFAVWRKVQADLHLVCGFVIYFLLDLFIPLNCAVPARMAPIDAGFLSTWSILSERAYAVFMTVGLPLTIAIKPCFFGLCS
jgi:hypothetical protein